MSSETQAVQLPIKPLTRKVEVEVCADCGKYARVFICGDINESGQESNITERKGVFRCDKDNCGRCLDYPYPLNQAAMDVSTNPILTAETQIVAGLTDLCIDIRSQDEIRKLAGKCGACLLEVAVLLEHKLPELMFAKPLKTTMWDIRSDEVRAILKSARFSFDLWHEMEHREDRHVLFPRLSKQQITTKNPANDIAKVQSPAQEQLKQEETRQHPSVRRVRRPMWRPRLPIDPSDEEDTSEEEEEEEEEEEAEKCPTSYDDTELPEGVEVSI